VGEWTNISRSSWLAEAMYDEAGRSLFLRLKTGAEVEVLDVAPRVWTEFLRAPSRGRYLWNVVFPNHEKRVL
jgi:hypothetical protein